MRIKNTYRKETINVIINISFIILALNFLIIPFTLVAEGDIDVFENQGWFKLSLFGFIRLFKTRAYLKHLDPLHNNLVLKGKKKDYEFHLNADKRDKQSIIKVLDIEFFPYVNIVSIDLELAVGKRDDALFTTLTLGGLKILFYGIFSFLKSSQRLEISENFIPEYNKDMFRTVFSGIINISFADIIYSFILYLVKKTKNKLKRGGKKVDNRA